MTLAALAPATAEADPIPPGVYDVTLSDGTIDIGSLLPAFPFTSDTTFPATIGTDPISQPIGLTVPPAPFSALGTTGTLTLTPTGGGVTIDPATRSATADASFSASVTLSGDILGVPVSGNCTASPISVHLTTADGSAWDPATNAFSLVDKTFTIPTPDCSPGSLGGLLLAVLGDITSGNNVITLLGTAIRRPDVPTTTNNTTNTTNTTSQSPTVGGAGTTEQPGTPTTKTPAVKRCVVPKLVGKTLKQAKRALKKAGCKAGKAKSKKSKKKKGRVIKQRYKAGKKLLLGTKVALTVSKGPAKNARKHR